MDNFTNAIVFFVGVGLALLAWVIVSFRRSPYTVPQSMLYFVNVLLARLLWRTSIVGSLNLDPSEGGLIVCNHRSSVDPVFVQLAAGRVVHWMVAREFFSVPGYSHFLRAAQAIPTNRGGIDTASTRICIRTAAAGGLIGVLPEGRINMSHDFMLPTRPGAVLIALKARVAVVPIYIEGAPYDRVPYSPLLMPTRVKVIVGKKIDLSPYFGQEKDRSVIRRLSIQIVSEIARLAGREDFQPQLAGRNWKPTAEELQSAMAQSQN